MSGGIRFASRNGAFVTGLDFSPTAIGARRLSMETGLKATFV